MAATRYSLQVTHCPRGHPYDERNTYVDRTGRRHCRACDRDRKRETHRRLYADS